MVYIERLKSLIVKKKTHLTIGIDPDASKIPEFFFNEFANPLEEFCKFIIETTIKYTTAYKFNLAFFEYFGETGFKALESSLNFISKRAITICDSKRGDIPNTSEAYAKTYFDKLGFDAVTVSPYMGIDSIEPFLNRSDKLTYILAATSNKGAYDFQLLETRGGKKLFEEVIEKFISSSYKNIGFIFGAGHSSFIEYYTNLYKNIPILIPGIGAQGGDLNKLLESVHNDLFLVNVSRAILYPTSPFVNKEEYKIAVEQLCLDYSTKINK
ncbi:MAG: orotidine-5'-phosphate decarboxylase [Ignavibacteria bacterium]|nr:orotidine-5'-phosphate decarboxylase [Ignavibacteria bacterium]